MNLCLISLEKNPLFDPDGHLKIPHLWSARNSLFHHPECKLITVHRQGLFFLEFLAETQNPPPLPLWLSMEE
jgi:hypothetical protein